jgi:hypothetical protein
MGQPGGGDTPSSGMTGREPGELKHLSTPRKREDALSSGERTGQSPNQGGVCEPAGAVVLGLDGCLGAGSRPLAWEWHVSRRLLERVARAGESPVGDGMALRVQTLREYRPTRDIGWEAGGTTSQG